MEEKKAYRKALRPQLSEEDRDRLFYWLFVEELSYRDATERVVKELKIDCEHYAVWKLAQQLGYQWKMEQAHKRAEAQRNLLPPDWEETKKQALAQREYMVVMEELTFREIMVAQRLELDRERLKLQMDLEPRKLELAKRKVELLESKFSAATETTNDTKLTPEEKQARMREIFGLV